MASIRAFTTHSRSRWKKKLGKRDGAKSVTEYRDEGILPEAMLNFLASMGWNDGTEQEVFTLDELIEKFSLNRVQRSGARFDEQRLLWLNGQHIRMLSLDDLYERVSDFWPASAQNAPETRKKKSFALCKIVLKRLPTSQYSQATSSRSQPRYDNDYWQ